MAHAAPGVSGPGPGPDHLSRTRRRRRRRRRLSRTRTVAIRRTAQVMLSTCLRQRHILMLALCFFLRERNMVRHITRPAAGAVPGSDPRSRMDCRVRSSRPTTPISHGGGLAAPPARAALPHGPRLPGATIRCNPALHGRHARRRRADPRPPVRQHAGGRGARPQE